jgi:hypothetical protein
MAMGRLSLPCQERELADLSLNLIPSVDCGNWQLDRAAGAEISNESSPSLAGDRADGNGREQVDTVSDGTDHDQTSSEVAIARNSGTVTVSGEPIRYALDAAGRVPMLRVARPGPDATTKRDRFRVPTQEKTSRPRPDFQKRYERKNSKKFSRLLERWDRC